VVDVNPFLLQLLGYSYDDVCGQYIWELGVFKDIAASKEAFRTLQENEYIRYDDLPLETLTGGHRRGVRQQCLPRGPLQGDPVQHP
jgi:PAS domain S-box-containing protein